MAAPPDDVREVEETVHRFFVDREPEALTTGPLRDLYPLLRVLERGTERIGFEVRRLAAVEVEKAAATVAFSAVARYERRENGRSERWRARLSGPVRLRRRDDGWKIADFKLDGRSVVASLHAVAAEPAERDGVLLRPRGALLHRRATAVYFEVENRRSVDVDVRAASTSLCYCGPKPTCVRPGERSVVRVSWPKRMSLRTREIGGRFFARERGSKEPFDFVWRLDLRKHTGAAEPAGRSLALRLYSLVGAVGFVLAMAALPPLFYVAAGNPRGGLPLSAGMLFFGAASETSQRRPVRGVGFVLAALAALELWKISGP